ncbi:MAG: hypothetical protein ACYCT0_08290 [Sulfobacillus sp.]
MGTISCLAWSPQLGRVGVRPTVQARQYQALRIPRPHMPPIKAVSEFCQIELPLGAASPVTGPINKRFRATNDRIDPVKHFGRLRI